MRKLVVAQVGKDNLKTCYSSVKAELQKLCYEGKTFYEKGKFIIVGRKAVEAFVSSMLDRVSECRKYFKDSKSIAEFDLDEAFLKSLLAIKGG